MIETTMALSGTFALLAAMTPVATVAGANSSEAALGVSATVVRPVDIAGPVLTAEGAVVVVRNSANVVITVDGAAVTRLDGDTKTITGRRSGPMTITVVY